MNLKQLGGYGSDLLYIGCYIGSLITFITGNKQDSYELLVLGLLLHIIGNQQN